MKLWILSDLHADRGIEDIGANPPDFDVFVCAGDVLTGDIAGSIEMVAAIARGRPAAFVAGNHEWMSLSDLVKVLTMGRAAAARHRVTFLECDTVEIGGVRFAGATLWTAEDVRFASSAAALQAAKADVVVTHFEPTADLLVRSGAKLWVYGHLHGFMDRTVGSRRLVRNALGYPLQVHPVEEMPRPDYVVEIEP